MHIYTKIMIDHYFNEAITRSVTIFPEFMKNIILTTDHIFYVDQSKFVQNLKAKTITFCLGAILYSWGGGGGGENKEIRSQIKNTMKSKNSKRRLAKKKKKIKKK
jgi:hypothetical protein